MQSIILIGFMGTGKSSVAEALSKKLKVPMADTDVIISKQKMMEDWEIIDVYGEEIFRSIETRVLVQLREDALFGTGTGHALGQGSEKMPGFDRVVSCGSGIVMSELNRQILKEMGRVVLLEAKPKTIQKNIRKQQEDRKKLKPLIGDGSIPVIEKLLAQRREAYHAVADQVIQIDGKNVDQICKEIMDA